MVFFFRLVSHLEHSTCKKDVSYFNWVVGGVSLDVLHGQEALPLVQIIALLLLIHQTIGALTNFNFELNSKPFQTLNFELKKY